jgi:amidohydrolase
MKNIVADKLSSSDTELLIGFRKELHANPELSGEEKDTCQRIHSFLHEHAHPDEIVEVGNYGLLAIFHGKESGKQLMLRGDTDALPIQEVNDFDHRSKTPGVSHKCGHDGHTCILLGTAMALSKNKPLHDVALLFQPAEENGTGAVSVLEDPTFQERNIESAIALHNLPGFPMNMVVTRHGSFTPSVKSLVIRLVGKTAHAAEPEHGINPALAIAEIIQRAHEMSVPDIEDTGFFLITPIHINMGEIAHGISAGDAELHFTIRSWTAERTKRKGDELKTAVEEIGTRNGLQVNCTWTQEFEANENDLQLVDIIRNAAASSGLSQQNAEKPFKWGEDFGVFTQRFPGAMFGLGAGSETPALHNPDYDFPDELIATGVNLFCSIIASYQSNATN